MEADGRVPIDTTFFVKRTGVVQSLHFVYYALSLQNLANLRADSAVPGLNRIHAYMSLQVLPPPRVLDAFDSLVLPLFAAINANSEQARTLATLRDTLLPKLLSGELSVDRDSVTALCGKGTPGDSNRMKAVSVPHEGRVTGPEYPRASTPTFEASKLAPQRRPMP